MYEIYINGEKIAEVVLPCWVFWDTVVKSFATCDYDKAEALYICLEGTEGEQESFYADLEEKPFRHEGFPVAKVVKKVYEEE